MRKINFFPRLTALSILTLVLCSGTTQGPEVMLTALTSMERITLDHKPFGEAQAVIKAARNEVESFQIVVSAVHKNVRVINAEMSELRGKTGTIGRESIALFREENTRVRQSSARAQLPPGLYPDPLVPFVNPQTGEPIEPFNQHRERWGQPMISRGHHMYALPFDVWKGQNQPIWVDVSIPSNAPAGEYEGTFTVTLDNFPRPWGRDIDSITTKVVSIPVRLTVWDFTLPDGPTHRNHFGGVRNVAPIFGVETNSEKFREIELRYCQMMADNRVNPPLPESLLPEMNRDGSLKISPDRHKALKKFMEDLNVTDFEIPRARIPDMTTVNRDKAVRYYRDYYKYVKDNGWDKRAYVYMLDEPNLQENYENVLALGALVHEAAPQLRCLVVEQPYKQDPSWPDIDSAVDIWCPLFAFIDASSVDEKLAHGDEVWSYTALSQRAPTYHPHYEEVKDHDSPYWHLDAPLTSYRTPTWMNWRYRINGLLYWSMVTTVQEPWHLPAFKDSGTPFNGGGYLIYPGVPCGIDGPVASIRLKVIRDSMEDYEYFVLLERLAGRQAVTKTVSNVAPEWWATSADPKEILAARERLAEQIIELTK